MRSRELPAALQVKLLHLLEEGVAVPSLNCPSARVKRADLAATHRDLQPSGERSVPRGSVLPAGCHLGAGARCVIVAKTFHLDWTLLRRPVARHPQSPVRRVSPELMQRLIDHERLATSASCRTCWSVWWCSGDPEEVDVGDSPSSLSAQRPAPAVSLDGGISATCLIQRRYAAWALAQVADTPWASGRAARVDVKPFYNHWQKSGSSGSAPVSSALFLR